MARAKEARRNRGRVVDPLPRFLSVLLMPKETQLHCGGATTRFTGERNPHLASQISASKTKTFVFRRWEAVSSRMYASLKIWSV